MSKKRAKLRFVWISLLVALGLFLTFVPFHIPATTYDYYGFTGALYRSACLDLTGGQAVIFDCKAPAGEDLDKAIEDTLPKLDRVIGRTNIGEYKITKQGQQIRVDVKEADQTLFEDWLSNPKKVNITLNKYDTEDVITYLTTEHIADATPTSRLKEGTTDQAEFGIELTFTSQGARILSERSLQASTSSDKNMYVYLGEVNSDNLLGTIDCSKQIKSDTVFVAGDAINSDSTAVQNAYYILSGTFDAALEYVDTFDFSAVLGQNTMLFIGIAFMVMLVAIMIAFFVRYGQFGLLADLALVVFVVLDLFFLQAIPLISLSIAGVIAMLLGLALFVDGVVVILERVKQEYAAGKKIPLAVKSGFKRALWPLLDSHVVLGVLSLILYFVGPAAVRGFAFPFFVAVLLSFFTNMVITRFFINSYLPLNSTNAKKLRLHREKGVVEVKEEEEKKPEPEGVNALATAAPDKRTGGEN